MKRIPWFEILLTVVVISISLYAALSDGQNLSRRWFTRDDAYYYFKVAQNISEGHGSTFDGINPTNGYHPLWMWVCVPIFALARFDLILPLRILLVVMSGLSVATAIFLYRLIGKVFTPAIGAMAALFWVFSFVVLNRVYKQGLETGIAGFFVALLAYKLFEFERTWRKAEVTKKQLAMLGVIAMLMVFSRLDLVFLAGFVGIWIIFRDSPLRYYLSLDIVSIFVATLLAFVARFPMSEYYYYSSAAMTMIALSLIVKIPGAYLFGLYQQSVIINPRKLLWRLVLFTISGSGIVSAAMIALTQSGFLEGFPRTALLLDAGFTFVLMGTSRLIAMGLRTRDTSSHEKTPLEVLRPYWKEWVTEGFAYYGVVFGALVIYMLWNKIAFGTFSPVSGQIKRWWGSLSGQVYGGAAQNKLSFFGINYLGEANAWAPVSTQLGIWAERLYEPGIRDMWRYLILLSLFALGFFLVLLINKQKAKSAVNQMSIVPLLCGAWLQVFNYHATGYSAFREWYWVSQLILVVLVMCLILGMLFQLVRKIPYIQAILWILAIVYGYHIGLPYWNYVQRVMAYNVSTADQPYNEIAALLEEHTEPGSIIGMTGGGNAGYFVKGRVVVNMDGLVNSYTYFHLLQEKKAGEYFAEIGMDYVLANKEFLNRLPYRSQFKPYLESMDIDYGGKSLMRYHSSPP